MSHKSFNEWVVCLLTFTTIACIYGARPAYADPGDHDGPYSQGNDTAHLIDPAIPYDDLSIQAWATGCEDYYRSDGQTGYSDVNQAIGAAGTSVYDIVSLGDLDETAIANNDPEGYITLSFDVTIANGPGFDIAVFENGFGNDYCELAFVEVSSDGIEFARFDNTWFGAATAPVGGYAYIDATYIYGLAGKHMVGYGTPFDLEHLVSHPKVTGGLVDLNDIHYVRLVDIPGSGDWTDDSGNPIYDSWVTFGSGGADIDGIAVLNVYTDTIAPTASVEEVTPDPRTTPVPEITIIFSEVVQNFDVSDLELTRDGGVNLLTGTEVLSTLDDITWTLDTSALSKTSGDYTITVLVSDITDLAGNPLDSGTTDTWTKTLAAVGQNGYVVNEYFITPDPVADPLVSFDWDASDTLYYSTGDASYANRMSVWKYTGGAGVRIFGEEAYWSGARVTRVGNYIFFNEAGDYSRFDDFYYYRYDPVSGDPPVNLGNGSTLNAWGLNTRTGQDLFVSAGGSTWSAGIYYTALDGNGDYVNSPWVNLGQIGEPTGPLAFDVNGNLYYAHGYASPAEIFRFTTGEVDAAILDATGSPLDPIDHSWADLDTYSGATGMACDIAGNVILTATSFTDPSELRLYHTACDGSNNGYTVLATHSSRFETVRYKDGQVYVSTAEGIFAIPMPPLVVSTGVVGTPDPNEGIVEFQIIFSESVTGVNTDMSDFTLATIPSGATTTPPSIISGTLQTTDNVTYTISIDTGEYEGQLLLDVVASGVIADGDLMGLSTPYTACHGFTIDTAAPDAPTMDAEPLFTNGYENTVSWSVVADAAGYHLECYDDEALSSLVEAVDIIGNTHTFSSLLDNTTYWYRVQAIDTVGNEGAFSNVETSTQNGEILVLSAVGNLAISVLDGEQASMSVTASAATGTVYYQWYRIDEDKAVTALDAFSPTYEFIAYAATDNGVQFYCQAADDVDAADSETFNLTVTNGVSALGTVGIILLAFSIAIFASGTLRKKDAVNMLQ